MDIMGFLSLIYSRGVTITITIRAAGTGTPAPDKATVHEHIARCECGWNSSYETPSAAERGLRTHQTRHCVLYAKDYEWLRNQSNQAVLDDD